MPQKIHSGNEEIEIKIEVQLAEYERIHDLLRNESHNTDNIDHIGGYAITDSYYTDNNNFKYGGDMCMRIRRVIEEKEDGNTLKYNFITYKNRNAFRNGIRFNKEYETNIDDYQVMDRILLVLGFEINVVVQKGRISYLHKKHNARIELDAVSNLGYFIEIESTDESGIKDIMSQYSIQGKVQEKSYAELCYDKQGIH